MNKSNYYATPARGTLLLSARKNFTLCLLVFSTITSAYAGQNKTSVEEICRLITPSTTILHPDTCNTWVQCPSSYNAEDLEEGSCVFGLYFNKDAGRCESKETVTCPYESTSNDNRCAFQTDGTFLADPNDCSGYIFCNNQTETRSTCPDSLIYNPEKGACVYSKDYNCQLKPAAANVSTICKSVAKNTVLADISDCTKYLSCDEESQLISIQCSEGQAFNYSTLECVARSEAVCHPLAPELEPEIDVCGTEDNVLVGYIADEESCSGYYICAKQSDGKPDRSPTYLKCQDGYFFDSSTWSCRNRLNVKCSLDRCEGMANKYANVAGDCSAYARCKNGVTVATGICEGNYFFDERSQACTQQNISYTACTA